MSGSVDVGEDRKGVGLSDENKIGGAPSGYIARLTPGIGQERGSQQWLSGRAVVGWPVRRLSQSDGRLSRIQSTLAVFSKAAVCVRACKTDDD